MNLIFLPLILLFFVLSNLIIPSDSSKASNELLALDSALDMKVEWDAETVKRKPLLCTSFINSGKNTTLEIIFDNLKYSQNDCDWAFILYKGETEGFCDHPEISKRSVICLRNEESKIPRFFSTQNNVTLPLATAKTVLYLDIMPVIRNYERIILLDEDISFKDFSLSKYFSAWDCVTKYPPLISQPILHEPTQIFFPWAQGYRWLESPFDTVVGASVHLIEQQIPAFDARFFEWFVKIVIAPIRPFIIEQGADMGHDHSWCRAARDFSRMILHYPRDYHPCMIYPRSGFVHHHNLKTIGAQGPYRRFFTDRSYNSLKRYTRTYPSWVDYKSPLTATYFSNPSSDNFIRLEQVQSEHRCASEVYHRES